MNPDRSVPSWGWIEAFVLIQYLANGILLFPGSQSLRFAVRALPYAVSLGSLVFLYRRRQSVHAPGALLLQLSLILLTLNLLHPETQVRAGLAQIVFQCAILCPIFWASQLVRGGLHLNRLMWLLFLTNAVGACVGLLQIYDPERFLPAEFSAHADASWLNSLSYLSTKGTVLVRPPGLSDLPGGAAVAGSLTAILGLALGAARNAKLWRRVACFALALAGVSVLYFTQVRSLTVMTLAAMVALGVFSLHQRTLWNRAWLLGASALAIGGAFVCAVAVGGDAIRDRFLNLAAQGLVNSYQVNRGIFWDYTFGEALLQYPLGAGLGRWGMMNVYFGDLARPDSVPVYAEIQFTGWLYDGGFPLWILYGAAIVVSLAFLFRVALSQRYGPHVPFAAALAFCVNFNIVGASLSGPAFNTTLGLQYWLLVAMVYGAAKVSWRGPSLRQMRLHFRRRPERLIAEASFVA